MFKTDLMVNIQIIQDQLSELLNIYLCLIDEMGKEISLPSGLPLECFNNQVQENSKCQNCTNMLIQNFKKEEKNVTLRCPYGLFANISLTSLPLPNKNVYLIAGRVRDIQVLETNYQLLNSLFNLPLMSTKETTKSKTTEHNLTQQEIIILNSIHDGLTNKEIAADLCISLSTVKTHIANIFKKLGVNNRTEAARIYKTIEEKIQNAKN